MGETTLSCSRLAPNLLYETLGGGTSELGARSVRSEPRVLTVSHLKSLFSYLT